jgi:CBS domain-containing protein
MLDRREVIQAYNDMLEKLKSGSLEEEKRPVTELEHLESMLVKNAMNIDVESIHQDTPLERLQKFIFQKKAECLPVLNERGHLLGIITLANVIEAMEKNLPPSTPAIEIAATDVVPLAEEDTLLTALRALSSRDCPVLPVIDGRDTGNLVGVISRSDIMSALSERIFS